MPQVVTPAGPQGGMVLGTAQLAVPYGSVTQTKAPSPAARKALVRCAIEAGVTQIDTARDYPGSEHALNEALSDGWDGRVQVITKLDPLTAMPEDASASAVSAAVDASIARSREALRTDTLTTVLLHRPKHLHAWHGAAWRRLVELRNDGLIGRIGVSLSTVEEAIRALVAPAVQHIQLPFNILDTRWASGEFRQSLAARTDVVVHARSALLQGILVRLHDDAWPPFARAARAVIQTWLMRESERLGRDGILDLCIAYVRAHSWIHGVVIGAETVEQVDRNAALFHRPPLSAAALAELELSRPPVPERLLNPGLWLDR